MTKYVMYRYEVKGKALSRTWSREVNAVDANDAKWAARSDWAGKHGSSVVLTNVSAKRIGLPGFNLKGWKEV